ncbi:MAG: Rpn family recombination-promoting nuclease/putative transposase [bacterium]|nr:Rpn family recombination-promoting nuclease/putative transposase [bacterium]
MTRQTVLKKNYEELDFTDDFMFCKVLQSNENLCKELIELITGKKISRISFPEKQKTIEMTADNKGIRLDIYVEDDKHSVYDVEMQMTKKTNLPKRSRYYQGLIDLNLIERGEDYRKLRKSYIIFIMMDDFFGEGLHLYTFTNLCKQIPELELGDEAEKIFLCANGTADDISADMKEFLDFLKERSTNNKFTKELADAVDQVHRNENWRLEYMTRYVRDMDIREEGREIGESLKLISQIKKKIQKSKALEIIADEIEETPDSIRPIYDLIKQYPEKSAEEIYEFMDNEE